MMRLTHPAKGGKLNEMVPPRLMKNRLYLSGSGTTGRLRWPAASSARTANITLSFETCKVARVPLVTAWTCSQSGALVARQMTSYAAAHRRRIPGQSRVVFEFLVRIFTLAGGAGAAAKRGQGRGIQPRYVSDVVEVDEPGQVAIFDAVFRPDILMLVVVVFAKFRKADGRESLLIER